MVKTLFITVFMARSGSKFLRSLLNQHPDIHDFGECFHDRPKSFSEDSALLAKLGEIFLASAPLKGVQLRYPRHFREFPEIVDLVTRYPAGVKCILLKRRNKLKGAISQQNSERLKKSTGKAHMFRDSNPDLRQKLALDIPRAVKEAQERARLDDEYLDWARALFETHEVYYEDLVADEKGVVNGVCRFLGVNPFKPGTLKDSTLVKVTSDNLENAIENYDDLVRAVQKSGDPAWLGDAETVSTAVAPMQPRPENVLVAETVSLASGGHLSISAYRMPLKTNARFVEQYEQPGTSSPVVLAVQNDDILESRDFGKTWQRYEIGLPVQKVFTTTEEHHLLQCETGTVHVFDASWRPVAQSDTGNYAWHGSWSIDQCPETKTIIWCEYPYCAETVRVWRSVDGGKNWASCFTETGHESDPKKGNIRHFHLVQKCTSVPGRWYLGSGDTAAQSRFWVSENDGKTWSEVTLEAINGLGASNIPEKLSSKVFRFTGMVQTENRIIWATDDTFSGAGAKLCSMDKSALGIVEVSEGHCGFNEIRNLIRIDDRLALAVSEAKLMRDIVSLTLVDYRAGAVEARVDLPNMRGTKSNFMNGLSARNAAPGGCFFARSDNITLYPAPMTILWRVQVLRSSSITEDDPSTFPRFPIA